MEDLIKRSDAIEMIENFQRELCPVGMTGRHAVYGSDREKYDAWQDIIDLIENVPAVEDQEIKGPRWISVEDKLPEVDLPVLVCAINKVDHTSEIVITSMSDRNIIDPHIKTEPYWHSPWQYFHSNYEITHWMRLPTPPERREDDATN